MAINKDYKDAIAEIIPYIGKHWKYITQDEYGGVHMFSEKPIKYGDGFIVRSGGVSYFADRGVFLPLDIPRCDDWTKSKIEIIRNSSGTAVNIKRC